MKVNLKWLVIRLSVNTFEKLILDIETLTIMKLILTQKILITIQKIVLIQVLFLN